MNEVKLSNNLAQIELEINHHKQVAGQSIWEIGRRLNHVKEHDLAHGQFINWLNRVGISHSQAKKMMKIASTLPNGSTLNHLGTEALYLIATLPEEEKQAQLQRVEAGDSLTVRELQFIRKKYSSAVKRIAELEKQSPATKTVEVTKEVVPPDYHQTKSDKKRLEREILDIDKRNKFLEKSLNDLYAERAEVNEKSSKYDELTKAIHQSQGELSETQSKIGSYKNLLSFLRKGNEMLLHMGGLLYIDEERIIQSDTQIYKEFEQLQQSVNRLADDLNRLVQTENNIVEGVFYDK